MLIKGRDVCLGTISVRDAQKLFVNLPAGELRDVLGWFNQGECK